MNQENQYTHNQKKKNPNYTNTLQLRLEITAFPVGLKIYGKNFQNPDCVHNNSALLFEHYFSLFYSHSEHNTNTL